jgi:hypothetical protein
MSNLSALWHTWPILVNNTKILAFPNYSLMKSLYVSRNRLLHLFSRIVVFYIYKMGIMTQINVFTISYTNDYKVVNIQ